jgi:hypothetical protein
VTTRYARRMRWIAAVVIAVGACGARQAAPRAVAAPVANDDESAAHAPVALVLYEETPVDDGVVVLLREVRSEQPRVEFGEGGGFAEREPATAYLEIRHDGTTEVVDWQPGRHEIAGVTWRLAVDRQDNVTMTREP